MAERDDSHWEGMSASIERGEYTVAGPVELGPAAVTDDATSPPPTTVAELRRLLDHLPPGMPVLVDGYEAAFAAIGAVVITEVVELSGRPSYMGRFEHPADAARAVAGEDAAAWRITEPGPLPQRVGEPVVALVLRREVREVDE